jgi:hypothetical protein
MKNGKNTLRLLIIMMVAAMASSIAAADRPKPPKKEQKIVQIRGNQAWLNTGIRLRPQDRVTIKATGKVCFSNDEPQSCVDPDGWGVSDYSKSWPYNWNYCDDPEKSSNHAALIANVGHPDFFVGRHLTFFGKDGTLYLGVNDCTLKGDYFNSGEFNVVIVVERNAVPKP